MDRLLNDAPCGFVSFRDDGTIVHVNGTITRWLGYSDQFLIGKNIELIFTIASRIFYNTHFFPLLKLHSKAEEIFMSIITENKQHIPVLTNSVRRLDDEDFIIHCVMIQVHQRQKYESEILNARRQAEDALKDNKQLVALTNSLESRSLELDKQFQKLQTINASILQFGKIISHDMQEPIHKIQVFTDIISNAEQENLSAKSRTTLQKIIRAAQKLKQLTTNLQQYLNLEDDASISEVNLNDVIERAKTVASDSRNFKEFDLNVEPLPSIKGYERQLELMFYNLIDNSIQFRDPETKLRITITGVLFDENVYKVTANKYKFSKHLKLVYRDNGTGFEPQYSDYIFELLKKINTGGSGLGIGMSLVKKVTENHFGSIDVESKPNEGSTFIVVLPVRDFANN